MQRLFLWLLFGGLVYYGIEGIWHIPINGGWANILMLFIGGICFVLIGGINQIPKFYKLSIRAQSFIGTLIVLIVEFLSGYILNIRLKMDIWDYSEMPFNILGQVCLLYGALWLLLLPFAIWLEDRLNLIYVSYKKMPLNNVYDYTLLEAYKEFFKL